MSNLFQVAIVLFSFVLNVEANPTPSPSFCHPRAELGKIVFYKRDSNGIKKWLRVTKGDSIEFGKPDETSEFSLCVGNKVDDKENKYAFAGSKTSELCIGFDSNDNIAVKVSHRRVVKRPYF